ncbi:10699_t:CDS:2, partial [Dentiscutata heterogama]
YDRSSTEVMGWLNGVNIGRTEVIGRLSYIDISSIEAMRRLNNIGVGKIKAMSGQDVGASGIGCIKDVGVSSISYIKVISGIDVGSIKDMSSGIEVGSTSIKVLDDRYYGIIILFGATPRLWVDSMLLILVVLSISCIKVMSSIDVGSIKNMSSSIEVGSTSVRVLDDSHYIIWSNTKIMGKLYDVDIGSTEDVGVSCIKVMSGIDVGSIKDMSSSIEVCSTSVRVLDD